MATKSRSIKELTRLTGGLGNPSKMPGYAYGLSAYHCKLGRIMARKSGSICSMCYAQKGNYDYPSVRIAHAKREAALHQLPRWTRAMSCLIAVRCTGADKYFRWHDSGDLQSVAHLRAIAIVARQNPKVKFWLPTREYALVKEYCRTYSVPDNLVIRLSAHYPGKRVPVFGWRLTATVNAGIGFKCPAQSQGNSCGDCRACWDKRVRNVDYGLH
jgi:hypothetical protein